MKRTQTHEYSELVARRLCYDENDVSPIDDLNAVDNDSSGRDVSD